MYCFNCGKQIEDSIKYCPHCGTFLGKNSLSKGETNELETFEKKKIVEHLKMAKMLEIRLYKIGLLINDLDDRISYLNIKKDVPLKKIKDYNSMWAAQIAIPMAFILFVVLGIFGRDDPGTNFVMMITIIPMLLSDYFWKCFFISIACSVGFYLVCVLIVFLINMVNYHKRDKEHEKKLAQRDYEYNENLRNAQELQNEKNKFYEEKHHTEEYLKELYSMNILFPKYRNLVAVVTIYEYFVSGRCDKLTGHEGAYNIFESELRQNIIIDSLDNIAVSLNEIKRNQYMLYQAIQSVDREISSLMEEFDDITKGVNTSNTNTAKTAYEAKIAAENTEILAYLNIIA